MTAPTYGEMENELLSEAYHDAKFVYDIWASAGGTYPDHFPFDGLSLEDKKRWLFFFKSALTYGGPEHRERTQHPDVEKFGSFEADMFSYMLITGEEYANPGTAPSYSQWREAKIAEAQPSRWQFWRRPVELEPEQIDRTAYWDWVFEREQRRTKTSVG